MKNDVLERVSPLLPVDFFSLGFSIPYVKKPFAKLGLLPDTSELLGEESFAKMLMGWCEEGIYIELRVAQEFHESAYPNFALGDSLELFFDTRDVKSAGFATRFCHHFVLLPQAVQGIEAQEVTHFRSEDTHPLSDSQLIEIQTDFGKSHYQLRTFFPAETLHGFDPNMCDRLGFTYKVNRFQGDSMHFSVSSQSIKIAQQPSLWASLQLETKR